MRTLRIFLATVLSAFVLSVPLALSTVYAGLFDDVCKSPGTSQSEVCQKKNSDPITGPNGILTRVTNIIALIAGITAVVMIIIAGFMYLTSGGDSGKVTEAKHIIIYTTVGLVVIVLARSIILFVISKV